MVVVAPRRLGLYQTLFANQAVGARAGDVISHHADALDRGVGLKFVGGDRLVFQGNAPLGIGAGIVFRQLPADALGDEVIEIGLICHGRVV